MPHGRRAGEPGKLIAAKDLGNKAHAFVSLDLALATHRDARRLLSPVLEGMQGQGRDLGGFRDVPQAHHAAGFVHTGIGIKNRIQHNRFPSTQPA